MRNIHVLGIVIFMSLFLFIASVQAQGNSKSPSALLKPYLNLSQSLAQDDLKKSKEALEEVKRELFTSQSDELKMLGAEIKTLTEDSTIKSLRSEYARLSKALVPLLENESSEIRKAYCPMALNNKGAYWLQKEGPIRNPYFGSEMLECGLFVKTKKEI